MMGIFQQEIEAIKSADALKTAKQYEWIGCSYGFQDNALVKNYKMIQIMVEQR